MAARLFAARLFAARILGFLLAVLAGSTGLHAQGIGPFGPPQAAYAAHASLTLGRRSYEMEVVGNGPLERRDMVTQGIRRVLLIDQRARRATLMLPDQRLAMDTDIASVPGFGDFLDIKWKARPLGTETIDGVRTRRHHVEGTNRHGDRVSGVAWLTPQNILVRADLDVVRRGKRTKVSQRLTNLRIGPVSQGLLRVPAGYRRMPLPSNLFKRRPE